MFEFVLKWFANSFNTHTSQFSFRTHTWSPYKKSKTKKQLPRKINHNLRIPSHRSQHRRHYRLRIFHITKIKSIPVIKKHIRTECTSFCCGALHVFCVPLPSRESERHGPIGFREPVLLLEFWNFHFDFLISCCFCFFLYTHFSNFLNFLKFWFFYTTITLKIEKICTIQKTKKRTKEFFKFLIVFSRSHLTRAV